MTPMTAFTLICAGIFSGDAYYFWTTHKHGYALYFAALMYVIYFAGIAGLAMLLGPAIAAIISITVIVLFYGYCVATAKEEVDENETENT